MPTKKKTRRSPRDPLSARELAQEHAAKALQKLVTLMDSKNERVVLSAAQTVLDRAHGKAGQARDSRGPADGLTVKILRFNHMGDTDAE